MKTKINEVEINGEIYVLRGTEKKKARKSIASVKIWKS